jgi:6-phospho-beta-glucosidase
MKIAIIGGGSAYAPGLLQAFAAEAAAFAGAELALMDVAERELDVVHRLGLRLLEGSGLRLTATTDRVRALDGADLVLTTFREGGLEARARDERLPLRHGVIGQETIGPGGFFFALRTIPVLREIAAELERSAPGATLVNYANPTQIVAEAVTRRTSVRCVAICDQTDDDRVHIAHALGVDPHAIELESVGLNHATWSGRCRIEGEDGVARMIAASDAVAARTDVSNRTKRQFELTRRFGQVPNSYLQYYYYPDETVAEARAAPATRAETIAAELPGHYRHFEEQAAAATPRLTQGRGGSVFGDFAVRVLRALATGERARLTLNVPNTTGALPDFDRERVVELPCTVEHGEIRPEPQPAFPAERRGLLRMLADYQAAAADAIWEGDLEALAHALAANPLVGSLSRADALLADRPELTAPYRSR